MGLIDKLAERHFRNYGEIWISKRDNEKCLEGISKFLKNCKNKSQITLAYISIESLFSKEYRNLLNKTKKQKIVYGQKPLTFIINGKSILLEDNNQLLIKYHSEILGKRFSERFNSLYGN